MGSPFFTFRVLNTLCKKSENKVPPKKMLISGPTSIWVLSSTFAMLVVRFVSCKHGLRKYNTLKDHRRIPVYERPCKYSKSSEQAQIQS